METTNPNISAALAALKQAAKDAEGSMLMPGSVREAIECAIGAIEATANEVQALADRLAVLEAGAAKV